MLSIIKGRCADNNHEFVQSRKDLALGIFCLQSEEEIEQNGKELGNAKINPDSIK
jgi:hypothetical protein